MKHEHWLKNGFTTLTFAACLSAQVAGAAELRATADDRPISRAVRVQSEAVAAEPESDVQLAQFIEPTDHRVLVEPKPAQQPAATKAPQPAPRTASTQSAMRTMAPSPTQRTHVSSPVPRTQLPPMGPRSYISQPAPSNGTRSAPPRVSPMPQETIVYDSGWGEEPVWGHPSSHACGGGDCCHGYHYGLNDPWCNLWFNAEMLVLWRKGREFPPLVTTGPGPPAVAGELGQPGTTTLFGGERLDSRARLGGRIELGYWLDPDRCAGVGGRFWQLGTDRLDFATSSAQSPVIARPFLDVTDNLLPEQATQLVAFPGETIGSVDISSDSDALGADVFLRRFLGYNGNTRIEYLLGYQMSRIDEDLLIRTHTQVIDLPPLPAGTTIDVVDSFRTRNEFHGMSTGLMTHYHCGRWAVDSMSKFGIGNMRQTVAIGGQTTVDDTEAVVVDPSGLLARQTNTGTFSRNRFVVAPEFNLTAGYAISNCAELTFGYTLMLWTGVVRPGQQIDPDLAVNLADPAEGQQRPDFRFSDHAYLIQGMNVGLRCRY